jgi:hypothetical protein
VTSQAQFDNGAVQIAIRADLTLWTDTVLETNEEVIAEAGDVVGITQRFCLGDSGSGRGEHVMERSTQQDF